MENHHNQQQKEWWTTKDWSWDDWVLDKRCAIIVVNVGKAIGPAIANFTIFMGGIPAINFYGWFTIALLMLDC